MIQRIIAMVALVLISISTSAQEPQTFSDWALWLAKKPLVPTMIAPAANATNVPQPVTFSWSSLGGSKFELYAAPWSPPSLLATVNSPQTTFTATFPANTKIYWKVRSFNAAGDVWSSSTRSFTTEMAVPPPPTIACPANQAATTTLATGVPVFYPAPVTTNGQAPITVTATPQSGSTFPIGVTAVTATALDALSRSASCTFTVTVTLSNSGPGTGLKIGGEHDGLDSTATVGGVTYTYQLVYRVYDNGQMVGTQKRPSDLVGGVPVWSNGTVKIPLTTLATGVHTLSLAAVFTCPQCQPYAESTEASNSTTYQVVP